NPGGADPLVRGRRPRRPVRLVPDLDPVARAGPGGPARTRGSALHLVQPLVFLRFHGGPPPNTLMSAAPRRFAALLPCGLIILEPTWRPSFWHPAFSWRHSASSY